MHILFISPEVAPFSQSGGLGSVCGALPTALAKRGHRVITVSPYYRDLKGPRPQNSTHDFWFWLDGAHHQVRFAHHKAHNITHVFVRQPMFDRAGYYEDAHGPFGDNLIRFALLCRAALVAPAQLGLWKASNIDVVHAHDWAAGLAPVYINALYRPLGLFAQTRTIMTLHNAAYQGEFDARSYPGLDLAPRHRATLAWHGQLSTLKAGIEAADHVTTVSPTFAEELCSPKKGFGLHELLRHKRNQGGLTGVLNGIDTEQYDPATHPSLPAHFTSADLSGKAVCKAALQHELGLPIRNDIPIAVVIARFAWQKGLDLLIKAAPALFPQGFQLAIMGNGDPHIEQAFRTLKTQWPKHVHLHHGYRADKAMRMYAGGDFCIMPSRFEPCGLSQLYAMRFGTLPIVRQTGGLCDTVEPWNPDTNHGTGFCFRTLSAHALTQTCHNAIAAWHHAPSLAALRHNAMTRDSSWDKAAQAYERLYQAP